MIMKTTMKIFMSYLMAVALVAFVSCKKDSLEEAVLPQNTVAENTTNSAGGTNGNDGTNGSDGTNGTNGQDGEDGEDGQDGEDGTDGVDGQDGADGATGPQGPAGPAGADGANGTNGADGATGPQGPKGDTGTANVIYSGWFKPNPWKKITLYSRTHFYYNKTASGITQQILDRGIVLVFAKLEGYNTNIWPTGQVAQLPYNHVTSTHHDTWSAQVTKGNIKIDFVNDENQYDAVGISSNHSFRYVIIPGGVSTGLTLTSKGLTEKDLRSMSYKEVAELFSISE